MNRRKFILSAAAGTGAAALGLGGLALAGRRPRILLRSLWQPENIGDVAHPLGMVALLRAFLPQAKLVLWTNPLDPATRAYIADRLPAVALVEGGGRGHELVEFRRCDFLLSGSSSGFAARTIVEKWLRHADKPFGLFGVTLGEADRADAATLRRARFVYCRDTPSLAVARELGVAAARTGFVPDDVFAFRPADDPGGLAYLRAHGLSDGRFLCCIPRYRFTPAWTYRDLPAPPEKVAFNQAHVEADHAPLRAAITRVVRDHGVRVLICAEDVTQLALGKAQLLDRLPADVRSAVVWRDRFWLPDEAATIYRRSAGVFGNDQHSAIMAVANGVPGIVCRSREQTSKGAMWADLGLGDWLFDLDRPDQVARIADAVVALVTAPDAARAKARAAGSLATRWQRARMRRVARAILSSE